MSPATRELLERSSAALNRRDSEAFLAFVHPDAEFTPLVAGADATSYRGHEGVRRWLESVWDTWAGWSVRVKAVHEIGERVSLVEFILTLRARRAEGNVETQAFGVILLDETGTQITDWRVYETAAAAREAALDATAPR